LEEFLFNQGMLCPRGETLSARLHPDRLLHAYPARFRLAIGFSNLALWRSHYAVAAEIERIQKEYGPGCLRVLTGASLTHRKGYLMGKFPHVPEDCEPRLHGRLCMVSAAARHKKNLSAYDRAANPWADILDAEVVWISVSTWANVSPSSPVHLAGAREGAKIIVVDPRITPIART